MRGLKTREVLHEGYKVLYEAILLVRSFTQVAMKRWARWKAFMANSKRMKAVLPHDDAFRKGSMKLHEARFITVIPYPSSTIFIERASWR